jgi:hypothetical protein
MPRAICRCGENLIVPGEGSGRIVCPKCGARVKIRTSAATARAVSSDGFIRFFCPCGRRLKVSAESPPEHGKCPDCSRIVPVPAPEHHIGHPEAPTEELNTADRERLERWSREHSNKRGASPDSGAAPTPVVPEQSLPMTAGLNDRAEVGLRVCPRCARPVHLGADVCRHCGITVPRR